MYLSSFCCFDDLDAQAPDIWLVCNLDFFQDSVCIRKSAESFSLHVLIYFPLCEKWSFMVVLILHPNFYGLRVKELGWLQKENISGDIQTPALLYPALI